MTHRLALSVALIVVTMVVLDRLESARTRMTRARRQNVKPVTKMPAVPPSGRTPRYDSRHRDRLKNLLAGIMGLAVVGFARPATAYVVEAITSIPMTPDDEPQLRRAFEAAVVDMLNHAIAFTPTVLTVRSVRIVGDRIYIRLLFADGDGEETMKKLLMDDPSARRIGGDL